MESQSYEFGTTEERLMRELSDKMRFVSYALIAMGVLLILAGINMLSQGGFSNIIYGIVQLLIGIWTNKAASSFRQIVDTRGNDIENLMKALNQLKRLYTLQYWLFIIALIIIGIAVVAGIISTITTR